MHQAKQGPSCLTGKALCAAMISARAALSADGGLSRPLRHAGAACAPEGSGLDSLKQGCIPTTIQMFFNLLFHNPAFITRRPFQVWYILRFPRITNQFFTHFDQGFLCLSPKNGALFCIPAQNVVQWHKQAPRMAGHHRGRRALLWPEAVDTTPRPGS